MLAVQQHDIEANPLSIIPTIGRYLGRGWLNLFLGAGISSPFGFPEWAELIARIIGKPTDKATLDSLNTMSDKDLARLVDPFDDATIVFARKVYDALL